MVLVYVFVRDNYNGNNLMMQKYEKLPKSYNFQAIFRFIMFFSASQCCNVFKHYVRMDALEVF